METARRFGNCSFGLVIFQSLAKYSGQFLAEYHKAAAKDEQASIFREHRKVTSTNDGCHRINEATENEHCSDNTENESSDVFKFHGGCVQPKAH